MTDRVHSLTVVLKRDLRDDDAAPLIEAIRLLKGVQSVSTHVSDPVSHMAEDRARSELLKRLLGDLADQGGES